MTYNYNYTLTMRRPFPQMKPQQVKKKKRRSKARKFGRVLKKTGKVIGYGLHTTAELAHLSMMFA